MSQFHISRQQFDALLASHRAFHEVAIKITDILQEPSRSAVYQSLPEQAGDDSDVDSLDCRRNISKDRKLALVSQNLTFSKSTFQVENVRARKAYKQKRQRSLEMYARASGSSFVTEYDFKYKFFSDDIYRHLDHNPEAVGFDPWSWACKTPDYSDVDAYNAYHQIDHGMRLQETVLSRKAELMEALFPCRTNNMLQCMSWPELEYSYGLHLGDIIRRVGFSKCDNAIGYMDSDVTSVIIEVGRFFTELDCSKRPTDLHSGNVADAAGPSVTRLWSEDTCKKFTLNELHRRCHEKDLMKDWEGNSIFRIIPGPTSGSRTTERQAEFIYILEAVFAIKRVKRRNGPLPRFVSQEKSQMFILDFLGLLDVPDSQIDVEQSKDQNSLAHDINLQMLMGLGGLRLVWSDCVDDHLRFSTSSRTLTLFWSVSLLDQSLLFWYNAHALKNGSRSADSHDPGVIRNPTFHVLYELRKTYRLLFHNIDAKHLTTTETCAVKNANIRPGIMVHDLRVNIKSSRARKILKYLLRAPLPDHLEREEVENASPRRLRHLWWPVKRVIHMFQLLVHRTPLPRTIATHLASGPPYSMDLCWHLENILMPYPALAGESESMRSFSDFPHFGSRLREIKFYMDNQKPSGWYQMWKDKRDRVQYVTFWAVLVFGTISIILALLSIAVSSAQTVAAFRSIQGGNQ